MISNEDQININEMYVIRLENIRHEIIHSNFSMEPLHCGDIVFCY